MTFIQRGQPEFVRATMALFGGAFVTFAELYETQPLMPELSRHFHVAPAVSSLSLSVATAALAISLLWISGVSDNLGRKRLMSVSLFVSAIISIIIAISPNFTMLLVLRIVQGVTIAGFPSIAMAYVNEEFHPREIGRAMGLYVSGTSVGGMMGRIVIGALSDVFSWQAGIFIIGLLSLGIALWFWFSLPPPRNFARKQIGVAEIFARLGMAFNNKALIGVYTLGFLLVGGFVTMYNYVTYLLMGSPYGLSQTLVGFIFIVYLAGTFSSAWMGKLADSIGRSKAMQIAIAIGLAGCLTTLFVPLFIKIAGLAIFTFGFFGAHSIASGWVGQLAPAYRAQASSLYLLFYYSGSSVAGAVGGLFWSAYGWSGVIGMITVLLAIAFVVGRMVSRKIIQRKPDAAHADAS
ncbi:MFS transporter [Gordoniibacillus kamchatkensis]|uniref:MFS transporter n=1 Tax=Gordoniibacillus kamchatkensis TaxID=1590651 RepID=A0ABR5AJS6_9BACL|nr:MFS transporter [Paenibacillus sp. VKM B-2647]KIL41281.1 MFS transporter [Paenibacillus sp. VKM B-2647]